MSLVAAPGTFDGFSRHTAVAPALRRAMRPRPARVRLCTPYSANIGPLMTGG